MWTQQKKSDFLDENELRRAAVDLLSRRDYSRLELFRKLNSRCEHPDVLERVLDDLQQRQWQSDQRFAESFINSRFSRGLGPVRIKQELREKGISAETISLVLEAFEGDWYDNALHTLKKKYDSLKENDPNRKQKLYRFMAYRGFTQDHIAYALDEIGSISDNGSPDF